MGDTIEVIQGTATVVEVAGPTGPQGPSGSVGATGATGPAGPAGTGIETLTTKGDLLSRNDSAAIRVGIGSTGQVLKVSAQGLPTWANESGAVSSVAGKTGVVTLDKNDVGLGNVTNAAQVTSVTGTAPIASSGGTTPAISISAATTSAAGSMSSADKTKLDGIAAGAEVNVNADWNASSGDAQILNKPSTFAPTSHAASHHASTGSDPLFDQNLNTTDEVEFYGLRLGNVQFDASNADDPQSVYFPNSSGTIAFIDQIPTEFAASAITSGTLAIARIPTGTGSTQVALGNHTHTPSEVGLGNVSNTAQVTSVSGTAPIVSSGGTTPAISVTTGTTAGTVAAGDDSRITGAAQKSANLSDLASASTARTNLGLGTAATAATGDFAAASHTHELTALAATGATNGHVLTANGSNGVTFAALPASGVTGAASSASDVLGVSGANITGVDAGSADRLVFWDDSANKLTYLEAGSGLSISGTTLTATGSGVTAVGASTADVFSVSGSDLVADDGGTIDSADPFIKWDDTNSKLVYANPLSRPSGAFYVGLAPSTTSLGTRAINIQGSRSAANQVAANTDSVAIGTNARAAANNSIAIGLGATTTTGDNTIAIGNASSATNASAISIGNSPASGGSAVSIGVGGSGATGQNSINIGVLSTASAQNGIALGVVATASAFGATAIHTTGNLRFGFFTPSFNAVYWSGQTTTNAATILNLDGTATNRFTIAASTALAVDILLVARRATTQDKWLVARRFLGIRRDGSNNTSLIGTVQEVAPDQSAGSPTWTYSFTADDVNECLQCEVVGATGETVEWRVTAFYRVA